MARSAELLCATVAATAFGFLTWRAHGFFPNGQGLVGHDYEWFLPTLVMGHVWNQLNGWLMPPHFMPALCGGVPFLANPQSVFYSLPQLLLLVLEPLDAVFATLLVSAAAGAIGCYVLLRRHFETSVQAATLGGTLFLLNGFLFYRMVVGHLTYHAIAVIPLLACVAASGQRIALTSARDSARLLVLVVLGGLLIAYVSYGGALNFQVPTVLAVSCAILLLQIERGFRLSPWLVLAGSCVWGILISAMKVAPAAILVSQYPRSTIRHYVFQSPADLVTLLKGFLAPATLSDAIVFQSGWGLHRHELEFGVSIVPAVLIGAMLVRRFRRGGRWSLQMESLALAGLLLLPIALTFGPAIWGRVLAHVPVINNNTVLVRWWALYLLPLVIATARGFDGTVRTGWRSALLVCCVAIAIGQEAAYNATYYTSQAKYDPAPTTRAYREATSSKVTPPIERISRPPGAEVGQGGWLPNDAFVTGASAWPCYEPLFGYHLELLPDLRLVDGPITLVSPDQRLNIVDPAMYFVRPRPSPESWRFSASRLAQAETFASYRPHDWPAPWWYRASILVSVVAFLVSAAFLALRAATEIATRLWRRRRRGDAVS